MVSILGRAGLWLAALLIAILAVAAAADSGFAVHMAIVAMACLAGLWFTLSHADYAALATWTSLGRIPPYLATGL